VATEYVPGILNFDAEKARAGTAQMREFGLELADSVEVQVLDSTADLRYLVLPRRPAGTENLSEAELAKLVNRDSMIGVTNPHVPETVAAS
jgi:nitrile hydratase